MILTEWSYLPEDMDQFIAGIKNWKPERVYEGDYFDGASVSHHVRPRQISLAEEAKAAAIVLQEIRRRTPKTWPGIFDFRGFR